MDEVDVDSINLLLTNNANPTIESQYYCTAFSRAGGTENCISVTVLGKIK